MEDEFGFSIEKTIGGLRRDKKEAKTLPQLIIAQGRFPFGLGRFCTKHLKQYALRDYYKNYVFDGSTPWEVWFGMRTDESANRFRKYNDIHPNDNYDMGDLFPSVYGQYLRNTLSVRLPIVDWTEEEVFEYIYIRII